MQDRTGGAGGFAACVGRAGLETACVSDASETIEQSGPAFAKANGVELCYETFGNPAHPPLVLVMGLAAQMILWHEEFCIELARQGRWVVRFDNRDIGRSTRIARDATPSMPEIFAAAAAGNPFPPSYTLLDMGRDTLGLCDALGIDKPDVVGASMGGAITMELAVSFPERLRTATFIMAPTGDPQGAPPTPAALASLMAPRSTDRETFVRNFVKAWRVLAAEHFPFDEERVRWEGETSFERGADPDGVSRQMLAIIASGNRLPKLHGLRVPALVIHGTLDPLVPLQHGLDVATAVAGSTLEVVPGMGHSLPRGAWPQILEAIREHAPPANAAR